MTWTRIGGSDTSPTLYDFSRSGSRQWVSLLAWSAAIVLLIIVVAVMVKGKRL